MFPFPFGFISMPVGWEYLIILVVALLVFGRRLPDVARSMGRSVSEFKKGLKNVTDSVMEEPAPEGDVKQVKAPEVRPAAPTPVPAPGLEARSPAPSPAPAPTAAGNTGP